MANRDITIRIGAKNTASAVLKKFSADVSKLARQISRMGQQAAGSFKSAGGAVSGLGRKFALMGGAATAGFAVAIRTFASFDGKMAEVQAITKSTGDEINVLRDKAKELGASTKFSAAEAAEGMKFLGMAGFDTNQILSGIGPTLSLAAAGGIELGEAADIASDVSSAFGLTAGEIGRVSDVIAAAATSANTDVLMMGETFKYAAPLAAAAGQSIEEMSAAAGILGNNGIKATMAGTDLAGIMKKIAGEDVQSKLREMGVESLDAEGNIRPLLDIMKELGQATESMKGGERLAFFSSMFERYGKSAIVFAKTSGEEIDRLRGKMVNSNGAAEEMANTMANSLPGLATSMKSAFEGLQIAIVEAFEVHLRNAVIWITDAIREATQWVMKNRELVIAIGAVGVAVGALGAGLMAFGTTLTLTGIAIGAITTVVTTLTTAIAFLATPLGLVVGGLAALSAVGVILAGDFLLMANRSGLLGEAWDQVKFIAQDLAATVKMTFQGISDAMKSGDWALAAKIGWAGVRVAFWEGLKAIFEAVKILLPQIWKVFKDWLWKWADRAMRVGLQVAQFLVNPTVAGAKMMKSAIDAALNAPMTAGGGLSKNIEKQIAASKKELMDLMTEARVGAEAMAVIPTAKAAAAAAAAVTTAVTSDAQATGSTVNPTGRAASAAASAAAKAAAKAKSSTSASLASSPEWNPTYGNAALASVGSAASAPAVAAGATAALQASESRLLSRGPAGDPQRVMVEEVKKQNKTLESIDNNLRESKEAEKFAPGMQMEMIA